MPWYLFTLFLLTTAAMTPVPFDPSLAINASLLGTWTSKSGAVITGPVSGT